MKGFWKRIFGGMVCLLMMGTAACGQEEVKVFDTLEEATAFYLEPEDRIEEVAQVKKAYCVVVSASLESYLSIGEEEEPEEPAIYYLMFEETEDGFLLRDETVKFLGSHTISGKLDWQQREGGNQMSYQFSCWSFGKQELTMEDMTEVAGYGEIHERDGIYYTFDLDIW